MWSLTWLGGWRGDIGDGVEDRRTTRIFLVVSLMRFFLVVVVVFFVMIVSLAFVFACILFFLDRVASGCFCHSSLPYSFCSASPPLTIFGSLALPEEHKYINKMHMM